MQGAKKDRRGETLRCEQDEKMSLACMPMIKYYWLFKRGQKGHTVVSFLCYMIPCTGLGLCQQARRQQMKAELTSVFFLWLPKALTFCYWQWNMD